MDFNILWDAIKIFIQAFFGGFITIISLIIILNTIKYGIISFCRLISWFLVEKNN